MKRSEEEEKRQRNGKRLRAGGAPVGFAYKNKEMGSLMKFWISIASVIAMVTASSAGAAQNPKSDNPYMCVELFQAWITKHAEELSTNQGCVVRLTLDGELGLIKGVDLSRCQTDDRAKIGRRIWDLEPTPFTRTSGCNETTVDFTARKKLGGTSATPSPSLRR